MSRGLSDISKRTRRQETLEKCRDVWGYGGEMGIEARPMLREVPQDLHIEVPRDRFPVGAQQPYPEIAPGSDGMVGAHPSPCGGQRDEMPLVHGTPDVFSI